MEPSQPPDEPVPADLRARVMPAVLDEMARWGVERFSIEALAERHHLDAAMIYRYWGDRQRLIVDMVLADVEGLRATTDTGSLRGDLMALAQAMTTQLNTEVGRTFLRSLVMDRRVHHDGDTRAMLWRERFGVVRAVVDRAKERGELRGGVNTLAAVQMVLAPLYIVALYTDDPIDERYSAAIADTAWHGLARK
ncbi:MULTISPECIES: TetR-like C-terminal domain-containing protein [unclassified Mycobacterium]|uniref:TetR-like C-terminal domain-containing protein n=1 Tax=unclassified Mycobacterium TaxID=2642494 RepID=UPI00096E6405|nr:MULTISPECIES: TetR-like C-terminal domain-containing protein [unclassified Mycobacterium]OMC19011.1 TetR family transcriptional regulator [Mycobacterium sp. SP-6446]OMC57058.1 TetR family transcriptional regulator [Mycobacterium sp. IS-836]